MVGGQEGSGTRDEGRGGAREEQGTRRVFKEGSGEGCGTRWGGGEGMRCRESGWRVRSTSCGKGGTRVRGTRMHIKRMSTGRGAERKWKAGEIARGTGTKADELKGAEGSGEVMGRGGRGDEQWVGMGRKEGGWKRDALQDGWRDEGRQMEYKMRTFLPLRCPRSAGSPFARATDHADGDRPAHTALHE